MVRLKHLFQPIRIGSMQVANRIVMCPMGTNFADESGMPTEQMAKYYAERAKGGAGLVVVEQTVVQLSGKWSRRGAGLWDDKFIPGWKRVVDETHSYGGKIAVQVGHIGTGTLSAILGQKAHGPSPLPDYIIKEPVHELTRDEIHQFIEDYAAGVERAVKAGFDAVEIHFTHGYLMAAFLSGRSNRRTDEYGGTLENRMRLGMEIIRAVRKSVGRDYPVMARIASVEPNGGRLLEETRVIARALVEEGLDALDVSAGSYAEREWQVPPYMFSPAFNIANIESIKRCVDVPVIGAGRITEPRLAEQLIAEGRVDMVALGRGHIADPEWGNKAKSGDLESIRRCIACNRCLDFLRSGDTRLRCNINPYVGREGQIKIEPAERKKKVLVVGGGPAGLYAASIAGRRGHDVTVWEKEPVTGGQIRIAAMSPQKHELANIGYWTYREAIQAGAKLETGKEATPENVLSFKADAVVIGTGGSAAKPDLPGINGAKVVTANDVLMGKAMVGQRVLVLGGGAIGCELAWYLTDYRKEVTIVEMLNIIGKDLSAVVGTLIVDKLNERRVNVITGATITEILPDGAVFTRQGKMEKLTGFDNIVVAMGTTSENGLYKAIEGKVPEAYCIGDAREPRKIMEALNDGLEVGLKL